MSEDVIQKALDAYLARAGYAHRPATGTRDALYYTALSAAFLTGYKCGLERGAELAERSWNTALDTLREAEHYPEQSDNALRDYLARPDYRSRDYFTNPDEDAIESEGDTAFAVKPESERLRYPDRSFNDPRCICSPFRASTGEHLPECPMVAERQAVQNDPRGERDR